MILYLRLLWVSGHTPEEVVAMDRFKHYTIEMIRGVFDAWQKDALSREFNLITGAPLQKQG